MIMVSGRIKNRGDRMVSAINDTLIVEILTDHLRGFAASYSEEPRTRR